MAWIHSWASIHARAVGQHGSMMNAGNTESATKTTLKPSPRISRGAKNMNKRKLVLTPQIVTFEQCLETAREIMTKAGNDAARMLGEAPPKLVETKLLDGSVRIVTEWPDGEQSNECVVQPISHQQAFGN